MLAPVCVYILGATFLLNTLRPGGGVFRPRLQLLACVCIYGFGVTLQTYQNIH
jgi:hypothetical protein